MKPFVLVSVFSCGLVGWEIVTRARDGGFKNIIMTRSKDMTMEQRLTHLRIQSIMRYEERRNLHPLRVWHVRTQKIRTRDVEV